jgi:hypothetical protein
LQDCEKIEKEEELNNKKEMLRKEEQVVSQNQLKMDKMKRDKDFSMDSLVVLMKMLVEVK